MKLYQREQPFFEICPTPCAWKGGYISPLLLATCFFLIGATTSACQNSKKQMLEARRSNSLRQFADLPLETDTSPYLSEDQLALVVLGNTLPPKEFRALLSRSNLWKDAKASTFRIFESRHLGQDDTYARAQLDEVQLQRNFNIKPISTSLSADRSHEAQGSSSTPARIEKSVTARASSIPDEVNNYAKESYEQITDAGSQGRDVPTRTPSSSEQPGSDGRGFDQKRFVNMTVPEPIARPAPVDSFLDNEQETEKAIITLGDSASFSQTAGKQLGGSRMWIEKIVTFSHQILSIVGLGLLFLLLIIALALLGRRLRAKNKETELPTRTTASEPLRLYPQDSSQPKRPAVDASVKGSLRETKQEPVLADVMEEIYSLGQGLRKSTDRASKRLLLIEQVVRGRKSQIDKNLYATVIYARTILDTLEGHLVEVKSILNFSSSKEALLKAHGMLKDHLVISPVSPETVRLSDGKAARTPIDWVVLLNSLLLRAEESTLAVKRRRA